MHKYTNINSYYSFIYIFQIYIIKNYKNSYVQFYMHHSFFETFTLFYPNNAKYLNIFIQASPNELKV
jgi:hypothetical protein